VLLIPISGKAALYMDLPAKTSIILVAVVTEPRDLEIARVLGWYRIPLRSAPKVVAVDYLAFYQTGNFGDEKWRIQYVAPVRGHELRYRIELLRDEPDHPHANLEYYKIQLGPLVELPRPILAEDWRRITFFYTSGEYLATASTIRDLIIQSEERQVFWQALRERASNQQNYLADPISEVGVDPVLLASLLGISDFLKGD